ncbi:MAG: DUF1587 domain-containing protein [Acidobacteriia bacterium]|nr:DUF1587 domain-containing protein [Terriglobia bacterium]
MVQAWPTTRPASSPDRGPTALRKPAMMALLRFGALFLVGSVLSSGASRERVEQALDNDIRPLLATYCIRCHGPEVQTVGIDFSVFDDHGSVLRSRPLWLRALRVLRENEMPPAGAQPTTEERRRMVAWIDDAVNNLDWSEHRQPGSVTIPRLNQDEYNNTIRDLTGLDLRPADAFPLRPRPAQLPADRLPLRHISPVWPLPLPHPGVGRVTRRGPAARCHAPRRRAHGWSVACRR